jgi:site-specific DNA recombinase
METLRLAPIVRVSTVQQAKQGESLKTQTSQIRQYVKSLGGVIPDMYWQYSGQEHATPGQERSRLNKLLNDSAKGLFDCVIVCDWKYRC